MKTMDINGITFEVIKPRKYIPTPVTYNNGYSSVTDAYANPSKKKRVIWEKWIQWYYDTFPMAWHNARIVVSSANCHTFAILANYLDAEGNFRGVFHITYCHKRLYLI